MKAFTVEKSAEENNEKTKRVELSFEVPSIWSNNLQVLLEHRMSSKHKQ